MNNNNIYLEATSPCVVHCLHNYVYNYYSVVFIISYYIENLKLIKEETAFYVGWNAIESCKNM